MSAVNASVEVLDCDPVCEIATELSKELMLSFLVPMGTNAWICLLMYQTFAILIARGLSTAMECAVV